MIRLRTLAAILMALLVSAASPLLAAPRYVVVDLGVITAGRSYAYSVNNRGQVVGSRGTATGLEAFVWDSVGGVRSLPMPAGCSADPRGINGAGAICGYTSSGGYSRACWWDANGSYHDLGAPANTHSIAQDISASGVIVGQSVFGGQYLGFRWTADSGLVSLGSVTGNSSAEGINSDGTIAGNTFVSTGTYNCCVWEPGEPPVSLGSASAQSTGMAINDQGWIVGQSGNKAALWQPDGSMTQIDNIPGSIESIAYGINDRGQVVGSVSAPGLAGFLWESGKGMVSLNSLIDSQSGWFIGTAMDINDNGWIVASGVKTLGQPSRAVLLVPVPEPSSLLAVTAGLGSILAFRRRRA